MDSIDLPHFLREHAIDPELVGQYQRYTLHEDAEQTRGHYPEQLARNQEQDLARFLKHLDAVGGVVIHRHPIPGCPPMAPEPRPNVPMKGRTTVHYHGEPTSEPLTWRGKPLHSFQVETPHQARFHIDGKAHNGVNRNDVHAHVESQKYRFLCGELVRRTYTHTHERMAEKPERLIAHLLKQHAFGSVPALDGRHEHSFPFKLRGDAARLDVLPVGLERIKRSGVVYFGIEGCIKSDAMLSAGAAVFSVPAVGQWRADELEAFAFRYLVGKTVVIVCDADGYENWQVRGHALQCRTYLRRRGVHAIIAAPPHKVFQESDETIKGVDDFLAAGYALEDMEVFERELPRSPSYSDVEDVYNVVRFPARRWDAITRDEQALEALSFHAGPHGLFTPSVRTLARIMETSPRRALDGVTSLCEQGAISTAQPLSARRGKFLGSYYDHGLHWEEQPTFVIHPAWRCADLPPRRLETVLRELEHREKPLSATTTSAITEQLNRIERLEAMRAETMDSVRLTVERLAERFCDNEAVRRKASELLDEL